MSAFDLHILLVQAQSGAAETRQLLAGWHVEVAPSLALADAILLLRTTVFDAVVIDLDLPESQWLSAFNDLHRASGSAAIVLLVAPEHEMVAEQALAAGAQDVLVHGQFDRRRLRRALEHAVARNRLTARTLQQSESRHRTIVDTLVNGFWVVDAKGRLLEVNDQYCRMTGYTHDELLTMSVADLDTNESPAQAARHIQLVEERGSDHFETQHRRKDGTVVDVSVSARFSDLDGGVVVVTVRDITQSKRAMDAMAQSQTQWQATFDAVTDAICLLDADHYILQSNAEMNRLFGPEGTSVVGRRCWEVVHATCRPIAGCPVDCMGLSGTTENLQAWEGDRCFDIRAAPMRDPMTGRMGAVHWMRDITASKRDEQARVQLQKQLQMSQKLEAVGQLAGGVAHDFNNLLSVIINFTSFSLEELPAGDPVRDNLLEVAKAGKLAAQLTRQLTEFSRKQVLEPEVLDLNEVAANLDRMLARVLGAHIDIKDVLAPDLGLVKADPGQIEQIIMNLAVNARDAMPNGGLLTVETANVEIDGAQVPDTLPGRYVMLAVSDNGCGMDAETQEHMFEPFFTTKEVGKGTGLGLATVHGIVKQSGGHITVYSEPGRGTTFKIYLPRVDGTEAQQSLLLPACRVGRGETVLVVEDDPGVRKLAVRILERGGFQVLTAANGREALLLGERSPEPIHLLLTDVVMPQMDGRELAERFARIRPGLPVLYMSGYANNALDRDGALPAGTRLIAKPFNAADLTRKVAEALDEDRGQSSDGRQEPVATDARADSQADDHRA